MTDIATDYSNDSLRGDLGLQEGQLIQDEGLDSAILHSLFTDRRATLADVKPLGRSDLRGWWGDLTLAATGDQYGSLLWLLEREKLNAATAERARQYAVDALKWLIEDGVAISYEVEVEILRRDTLGMLVTVQLDAENIIVTQYLTSLGAGDAV